MTSAPAPAPAAATGTPPLPRFCEKQMKLPYSLQYNLVQKGIAQLLKEAEPLVNKFVKQVVLAVFDDKNPDRNALINKHLIGDKRLDTEKYSKVIIECKKIITTNPEKAATAKHLKSLLDRIEKVWDDRTANKVTFKVAIMSQLRGNVKR